MFSSTLALQATKPILADDSTPNASSLPMPVSQTVEDDDETTARKAVIIPGKGNFNVENLRHVDLNMDITKLSLAELRVVRNALSARQGYIFKSKDLRSLFSTTTWYDDLFYKRYELIEERSANDPSPSTNAEQGLDYRDAFAKTADKYAPLKFTKEELQFIAKLQAREAELQKQNFKTTNGDLVNVDNILNPWQIEDFPADLKRMLARNGFAIVEGNGEQLFHLYEQNNYTVFPSFVTTDVYLQLFHFYFDCLLRDIEQERLSASLESLCTMISQDVEKIGRAPKNAATGDAAAWLQAYVMIAQSLLHGVVPDELPAGYAQEIRDEVQKCNAAEADLSPFLGYTDVYFPYSLFRPRGHYTQSEQLQRYFRTMMWLQTAPFSIDNPTEMQRAALLAYVVGGKPSIAKCYSALTEPLTFLLGAPDNVSILQVYDALPQPSLPIADLLNSPTAMADVTSKVKQMAIQQTRILPTDQLTAPYKINLMPQRYMPDAEVLQEMADTHTKPQTCRPTPKALDIMAAMGVSSAERILMNELKEGERWSAYAPTLDKMRQRMADIDWQETVATRWIDALKEVPTVHVKAPYFMQTDSWQKKSLNTALASYAELKHDAILYAKQPFGAECGGGGPPEPVLKGYVEPSVAFWKKAVKLNADYVDVLNRFGLMTEKAASATESVSDLAQFLLNVSEKELAGKRLTNAENDQIEIIGSTIEYISLELARKGDNFLSSWNDITGPDRKVACIADVYTANALNIPAEERCVLYEGVGLANEIYVVVEIEGQLWLTRGAVFSYRELTRPVSDPRLTDEEWQQWLDSNPTDGTPSWMKPILLPSKNKPKENAAVFYSSGC